MLEKHLCFPKADCQAKLFGGVWEAVQRDLEVAWLMSHECSHQQRELLG